MGRSTETMSVENTTDIGDDDMIPELGDVDDYTPEELADMTVLSKRQAQLLLMRRMGMTHREIGQELGIATGTVNNHSNALTEKLRAARATIALLGWDDA